MEETVHSIQNIAFIIQCLKARRAEKMYLFFNFFKTLSIEELATTKLKVIFPLYNGTGEKSWGGVRKGRKDY